IRTTPLISPPSCTSRRFATTSPCTTLVDWISMRSSARILPRTSPPMIASREITSPSTSPPFPTSTCRPARTVPTTVPSIFTTPSAVMSPTTRIPVPMMDSPASESSGPCGAGGHGDVDAGMRFGGVARPHLAPGDEAGEVERPVRRLRRTRLVAQRRRRRTGAYRDRTHEVLGRGRPLFPRRPDAQHGAQLLVVRLGPVQRRRELLHATVLLLEPRHLALQSGHTGGRATDRSSEREEQHDQQTDHEGAPLPCLERPHRDAVLSRSEVAIGVDDDGDAAIFPRRHPSNGVPRISSRRRARSSFE